MITRVTRLSYRCALLISIATAFFPPSLSAQEIRIRVLDGRNGHAISDEHVNVWFNSFKGSALESATDKNGYVTLQLPKDVKFLVIAADYYADCRSIRKNFAPQSYPVAEIIKIGVLADNTCGKFAVEPKPGELVFYVRPLHWGEALHR
jgi:hypothetical protein